MGWKTITGAVTVFLGYILQPEVLAILPEKVAAFVMAIGGLLTAFGLRAAVAKGPSNIL